MFEEFTDHARKAMALANREAMRLDCQYISGEHILLGIISEGAGTGATILKKLDIELKSLCSDLESNVKSQRDSAGPGRPYSRPKALGIIETAIAEARAMRDRHIGTEHLLLGVAREKDGGAASALSKHGASVQKIREEIVIARGTGD